MKAHTARTRRKPIVVREGPVTVPIYTIRRADGRTSFRVTWVPVGQPRDERTFSQLDEARKFARSKCLELAGGGVITLTSEESAMVTAALRGVDGTGFRLDHAVSSWREAFDLLPPGKTLGEVVREYLTRHPTAESCPPIPEIVEAFLEYKRGMGLSGVHLKDLESRLGKFVETHKLPMGSVRVSHVEDWLASMKVGEGTGMRTISGRTRVNYLTALSNLVRFCERRGWLGKGALELSVIERRRGEEEIGILTPADLRRVLAVTPAPMVPFIAVGAFSGMRHAELRRLDWADVGNEWIELKAAKTKTRARRLVPVLPVLAAWLGPYRKSSGPVVTLRSPWNNLVKICRSAGVTWPNNALRHSFGSYRLASGVPEGQVAMEMGNTPAVIFRHYRKLVTPAQAAEWFGVVPSCIQANSKSPTGD